MDQAKKNHVPRSTSGEEKLWIKLKINPMNKFEQGGPGGAQVDIAEDSQSHHHRVGPQRNDDPWVCNVCNKGFSSGKALGGHMRIHVQTNKDQLMKTNSGTSTNNGVVCSLCGKDFPSMKSLFGHMRCHPEREWRGIQPPREAKNSPISSSVSDPESEQDFQHMAEDFMTDLTESLPSWFVKAKRGRKALVTEEEFDAVEDLMRLARGDSLESGLTHKNRVDDDGCDFEAGEGNSLVEIESKKRRIEERDCCREKRREKLGKGTKGRVVKKEFVEKSVEELDDSGNIPSEEKRIVSYKDSESTNGKKRRRKKLKLRDVEDLRERNLIIPVDDDQFNRTVEIDKYKCSTCSKCFPTHQALGGHRSSHNKVRITSQNLDIESSNIAAGHEGTDELEVNPLMSRAEAKKEDQGSNLHQCKICNKIFSTGQALGGHKRCHWTGSADQAGGPNQAGSPGEASQTGRKVLEIDLNELPAMEDEEDGYDYYASNYSSHSSVG